MNDEKNNNDMPETNIFTFHHVITQEDNPSLKKCAANKIKITETQHRYVHSKKGYWLNQRLKLRFQNYIEMLFIKKEFTFDEVMENLEITRSCTKRLLKNIRKNKNNCYDRANIITAILIKPFSEEEAIEIIKRCGEK